MKRKVFVSYSKKDQVHLETFIRHVTPVLRSIGATWWSDRDLEIGEWNETQVKHNLDDSSLVVFLTSSHSLATDYIVETELRLAQANYKIGKCRILPVILSPCSWGATSLAEHTARPEKAAPILSFEPSKQDEEWVLIAEFIKEALMHPKCSDGMMIRRKSEFVDAIKNSEPKFGEKGLTALDIYVYPDLRSRSEEKGIYISAEDLLHTKHNAIIFGNTQSGKSLLAKKICIDADERDDIFVYISGADIKNKNPISILQKNVQAQYGVDFDSVFEKGFKVVIDDPSAASLRKESQREFYKELKELANVILMVYPESQKYHIEDIDMFDGFKLYDILDFNRKKREKLLRNWYQFKSEEDPKDEDLYIAIDARLNELDTFLSKDIVPARPFFILSILSQLESASSVDLNMTSYGHCYQALITTQLMKSGVDGKEVDEYVNLLTEMSFFIFKKGSSISDNRYLGEDLLLEFSHYYESEYYCTNIRRLIDVLLKCGIVGKGDDGYFFVYKYIFYFYVGKYIGENSDASEEVDALLDMMHVEESANVLIFLNHHNKNPQLLAKIESKVLETFQELKTATLSHLELEFLSDFIREVPSLVVNKSNDTAEFREKKNLEHDILEENNNKVDRQISSQPKDSHFARVNKSLKALDLIGQIIKNRHGSIKKSVLKPLAKAALESNLKFISFFLENAKQAQGLIVDSIAERFEKSRVGERDSSKDNSKDPAFIRKEARGLYLYLVYGSMFGIIRKYSLAVSSRESIGIANDAAKEHGGDVGIVYEAFLHLSHEKLDVEKMRNFAKRLDHNPIALRLIQEASIHYMYMKDVSYKEKQQVTKLFGLEYSGMKSLDWKRKHHV